MVYQFKAINYEPTIKAGKGSKLDESILVPLGYILDINFWLKLIISTWFFLIMLFNFYSDKDEMCHIDLYSNWKDIFLLNRQRHCSRIILVFAFFVFSSKHSPSCYFYSLIYYNYINSSFLTTSSNLLFSSELNLFCRGYLWDILDILLL